MDKIGILLAVFLFGGGVGGHIVNLKVDALQLKLDNVKREGELAQAAADAKVIEHQQLKEQSDHEYQTAIDNLNSNVERLRVARARRDYVPAAPSGSRSPELACFGRPELERTLRQFDAGLSSLVAEGDTAAVGLNIARDWAEHVRSSQHLTSPH